MLTCIHVNLKWTTILCRYAQAKEIIKAESTAGTSFTQATQTCEQPGALEYETKCSKPESTVEAGFTKCTQTFDHPSVSVGIDVSMPEIVIENIKHSNDLIMFYTGLPDFKTFQVLFESLMEHGAYRSCWWNEHGQLRAKTQVVSCCKFMLVMMRLRLGLLLKDLEFRFKIAASTISKIFNSWVLFMSECMRQLIYFF